MNILFSCAGRRDYLLNYFRRALCGKGKVIATDMRMDSTACSAADVVEIMPAIDTPNYLEQLMAVCLKHQVDLVIPLNDLELTLLARHRDEFASIGTHVVVSDPEVVMTCLDKLQAERFLRLNGFNTPRTYTTTKEALTAIEKGELSFPIVIKPRLGSGSLCMERADNEEELRFLVPFMEKRLRESILYKLEKTMPLVLMQEYIDGVEFGLDVINDLQSVYQTTVVKRKLNMRAGETEKATVIADAELQHLGERLGRALQHRGNLDCDIIMREGTAYVLDLNPRFGGGFPFSYLSGVDLPDAIIHWAKQQPYPKEKLEPKRYATFSKGIRMVEVGTVNQ